MCVYQLCNWKMKFGTLTQCVSCMRLIHPCLHETLIVLMFRKFHEAPCKGNVRAFKTKVVQRVPGLPYNLQALFLLFLGQPMQ